MSKSIIINFLLFQLGWFACVLGGAYDQPLLGSMIVIAIIGYHLYQSVDIGKELSLLLLALIIGIIFESMMTYLQLARYTNGQIHSAIAPVWMILMWPLFATTLNLSMRWLKGLAPLYIAVVGAVFAPLAYFAGNRLGAVAYDDSSLSLSIIAIAWAVLFPVLVAASLRLNGCLQTTGNTGNRAVRQDV